MWTLEACTTICRRGLAWLFFQGNLPLRLPSHPYPTLHYHTQAWLFFGGKATFPTLSPALPFHPHPNPTLPFHTQAWLFFRGKGGIEQAKQEAALTAFRTMQQQQPPARV